MNPYIILLIGVLVSLSITFRLIRAMLSKRLQKKLLVAPENGGASVPREFHGERAYSLAPRGRIKQIFKLINIVAAVLPVMVLAALWGADLHRGILGLPATLRFWVFVTAMFAWSAMTLWFLRSLMRHRQGTTVSLSLSGVRFYAPQAGLFPARDIFIRWGRIENVAPANPQHPSLIAVDSPDGTFMFDSTQAQEVELYVVNGRFVPVDSGNDLYRDLVEHSMPGMPTGSVRSAAGMGI
jgi:hypothetical protein